MDNQKLRHSPVRRAAELPARARRRAGALHRVDRHGRVGPRAPGAAQAHGFVREQKKPSASVVLSLHRGRSSTTARSAPSSTWSPRSVPELDAKSVTVVDQRGNLLSAANAGARGLDAQPAEVRAADRAGLHPPHRSHPAADRRRQQRARPGHGRHRLLATEAHRREVQAQPGSDAAPRSAASRSSESSQPGGTAPPGGVPGALSNQPPVNATAPITALRRPLRARPRRRGAGAAAAAATPSSTTKSTRRCACASATGNVKRLSAAVVVNYHSVVDAQGKPTRRR